MQHLREVVVDDLLEELVLGGTWRRHGDLDLSEKQLETRTEDNCTILLLVGKNSLYNLPKVLTTVSRKYLPSLF